jgi:hypothetical protein
MNYSIFISLLGHPGLRATDPAQEAEYGEVSFRGAIRMPAEALEIWLANPFTVFE